jgi:uncharacterized protein involved in type VI secretion and phage assembly
MADPTLDQQGRQIRVAKSPLGNPDALIATQLVGAEGLSRPFRFVVDFVSTTASIPPEQVLGKPMGLMVFGAQVGGATTTRLVHGRVARWAELGSGAAKLTRYRAELVPWLWMLSLSADCRTFEKKSVQEIVEAVCTGAGFTDFRFRLTGALPKLEYVAQYQESNLDFVSRLLEEHGLYYAFEFASDKHTLVISDSVGSMVPTGVVDTLKVSPGTTRPLAGVPLVTPAGRAAGQKASAAAGSAAGGAAGSLVGTLLGPLGASVGGLAGSAAGGLVGGWVSDIVDSVMDALFGDGTTPAANAVVDLVRERVVHTKSVAARDFHLLRAADSASAASTHPGVDGERFAFLGDLAGTPAAGEAAAVTKRRIEVAESGHVVLRGTSTACTLTPGTRVTVSGGPLGEGGDELHVIEVAHVAVAGDVRSGESADGRYANEFVAIPSAAPYRPERATARPSVRGTQTALVVGTGGSAQVDVDAQGRVLLQFPWDRGDGKAGKSQHRVHVAAPWAGAGWGTTHLPRIGQLVLVEFLEGDPDRPIVTGRVYSQNHAFPYALPENKTQSGTKSRSLGEGAGAENFNELRFEDKKGSEHVFLQAEKDFTINVKHDRMATVAHFDYTTVAGGEGGAKGEMRYEVVQGDQFLLTKEGNQMVAVQKGKQVVWNQEGNQVFRIDQGNQETVLKQGDRTVEVQQGDNTRTISGADATSCDTQAVTAQQTITLEANSKIELKCGGSTITLEPSAITLKVGGSSAKLEAAQVTITSPQVTVKGNAKVALQGPMVEVSADAMLTLKGAMTQVTGSGMLKLGGGVTMAG